MERVNVAYLLLGMVFIGLSFACLHLGLKGWRMPSQGPVPRALKATENLLLVVVSLVMGLEFVAVAAGVN